MNVNDFQVELPDGDRLEIIFNHQRDLMDKYHDIEEKNVGHRIPSGPHHTYQHWDYAGALDINDRASQLRIKDFCWRITEELTEATWAMTDESRTHFDEELIDALHFMVELMCLCGIDSEDLDFEFKGNWEKDYLRDKPDSVRHACFLVIERLGAMANTLKLKPWKTTAVITDREVFSALARQAFSMMVSLLNFVGFDTDTATAMYLKKNAVNKFRQRTNY